MADLIKYLKFDTKLMFFDPLSHNTKISSHLSIHYHPYLYPKQHQKWPKIRFLGHFRPFLPNLGQNRIFLEKRSGSVLTLHWPLIPCIKPEKTNEPILRKRVQRLIFWRKSDELFGLQATPGKPQRIMSSINQKKVWLLRV